MREFVSKERVTYLSTFEFVFKISLNEKGLVILVGYLGIGPNEKNACIAA